jgi:hypothetical protein
MGWRDCSGRAWRSSALTSRSATRAGERESSAGEVAETEMEDKDLWIRMQQEQR